MKKICHLSSVHRVIDTRIYHKECAYLAEAGFDVKLVVLNPSTVQSDYANLEIIPVYYDFNQKWKRIIYGTSRLKEKALSLEADVYHIHDPELLLIAPSLKRSGAKVIYDVHEDVPKQIIHKAWIPKPIKLPLSAIFRAFEHYTVKKLDAVITVVESIASRFKRIHPNVSIVSNYPIILNEALPSWNDRSDVACYVGDLTVVRGAITMIEAFGYLDIRLQLGGSFESTALRQRALQLKGWSMVDELGFLARPQVISTYKSAKIGLVVLHPTPSYVEGLPVKLLEYMSMGLAVVGSNFGMIKQIVDEHQCGLLVDPLNPRAIADAINYLIENPEIAQGMAIRGRNAALEKYNWRVEAKQLLACYESIL
jgi:glycosyltransferase involved in cell wall biosynthesis